MARYKVEGRIYRWGAPDIKRTRTIEAADESAAKQEFIKTITIEDGRTPAVDYVTKVAEKDTTKVSEKLAALPEEIARKVNGLLKSHHIAKFAFEHAKTISLEEDITYHVFHPQTGWNVVRMGGEWGGYRTGVAGAIGKTIELPVGSFVVEDQIFCGKYFIRVYHNNGVERIGA